MSLLYSIGEVSRMTGLSPKALRLYQDKGLLTPARIDEESGYRYYTQRDVQRAQAVRFLRDLQFSLDDIRTVLERLDEGRPLETSLAQMRARLAAEVGEMQRAVLAVDALIRYDDQARAYLQTPPAVIVREFSAQQVASIRSRGKYSDAGQIFPRLLHAVGPSVTGPPFCLFHEAEYRENDVDISCCVPVHESVASHEHISIATISAFRAATVVHAGPWDSVGFSWARLFAFVRAEGQEPTPPLRETYLRHGGVDPGQRLTELAITLNRAG
jgi:DNA-binding transcriptional MerR regulator